MSWFNRNKQEVKKKGVPTLPELPKLPELPGTKKELEVSKDSIPQLPSFPTTSLGEKFSQNNIKEAVTGKKEDEEVFDEDEMRMIPKSPKKQLAQEIYSSRSVEIPKEFKEAVKIIKKNEPVFIRIDKFEESMKIFNETRSKILEIENLLKNIGKIKEEEEKELEMWGDEIKIMKTQIERVDKDLFSKVE